MKTRQQAAEEWATENTFTHDGFLAGQKGFLAGCEHADKEHRDFYLLVREYFKEDVWREAKEHSAIFTKIEKHLAAFTEREQTSLPFKD